MREVAEGIGATLLADSTLTSLLGTWTVAGVVAPSIFTRRPVPDSATHPLILAATVVSDVAADYIGARVGRLIEMDVAIIGLDKGDYYTRVEAAAERVKRLLHQSRFAVAGWQNLMTLARGPVDAPAEPQEIARVVTAQVRLIYAD